VTPHSPDLEGPHNVASAAPHAAPRTPPPAAPTVTAPSPIPPPTPHRNPIRNRADWDALRHACAADPGTFHGDRAAEEIHWFDPTAGAAGAWITHEPHTGPGRWTGWDAETLDPVSLDRDPLWRPWHTGFDDREAPWYRWFVGARTNAAFNEVDRHVLAGHGDEPAFLVEGDRWDQSRNGGRGGPVVAYPISRRDLLIDVARAAVALRDLGLETGDRIALNLPNIPEQIVWTEAAKRLGILYTPVFGGFSDKTLADRIHNAGARVVITADGGYRNAQVVPFKAVYTDAALDQYLPVEKALGAIAAMLDAREIDPAHRTRILDEAARAVDGEITVERQDVMRGVGNALRTLGEEGRLDPTLASAIRTAAARALVETGSDVERVIVVRHTGQADLPWSEGRDVWAHDLLARAGARMVHAAREAGILAEGADDAPPDAALRALPDLALVRALWLSAPPLAVDAEFPLFFIYTSGSTGKPKGVVHVHGGYTAGIAHTMRVSFDAKPGDVLYVVADPGWITGQSYLISAALTTRVTSVLAEGSPVFPSAGRFASIIERYGVNIFKAGVTFLKAVMTDPQNEQDVRAYNLSSLRVATFCAEPTSPPVQQFGMNLMTPWYINSYWATEHGGIVWTHFYGNGDFPLRADAHTYPLPWVFGDVWLPTDGPPADGPTTADTAPALAPDAAPGQAWPRRAEDGEKGEIVITAPYPYLARTIWGDVGSFRVRGHAVDPAWRGDLERYRATYWSRWKGQLAYTQGDFAIRHPDGGFSLHGRSDDVINVSGHRMGTEEIEGAILRDKQLNPGSPVGNVIVVGAPHREKGLTPLAFVTPAPGHRITADDRRRLVELVRREKGAVAVPEDFLEVPAFPETRSGKYMRRMVRALVEGQPVGDITTLRNPEVIPALRDIVDGWLARQRVRDEQRILERGRYFRVHYHRVAPVLHPEACLALVTVTNPPVNALNERALDELVTLVEHLSRRDEVVAVIFTGQGTRSFVAGADIRQLLEEMHEVDEAVTLPNVAHLAFRTIERMNKPCLAAIQGVALGGGMEFALACHVRMAEPTATFGQPEIGLNLLPGYGGTQRLTRLLADRDGERGFLAALEILAGGRPLEAHEAHALGIVDAVCTGSRDCVAEAAAQVQAYALDPEGSELGQRFREVRTDRLGWERPGDLPVDALLKAPVVQRLAAQAHEVGRAAAFDRVLDAIRTGWRKGLERGLAHEARLFAEAVVDPAGGKAGIQAFFDRKSAPLPVRTGSIIPLLRGPKLEAAGELMPVGSPFFPGLTPIPAYQYGMGITRDPATGEPRHGDPREVEGNVIVPVERPGPNEVLLYVLASEVNFNDIWALTGMPVSPFDSHERDVQVTGSGGVALIAEIGEAVKAEGRLRVGDAVAIYSGQSELLAPEAGRDPMSAGFRIQGYETPEGSHQQFLVVQAPQCHPLPPDVTLEAAGSYILALGTVVRALFTTLRIEGGRTLFVEGAATGTGLESVKSAARQGVRVSGLVSSDERAQVVVANGGVGAINRTAPGISDGFTLVPEGAAAIAAWEAAGEPLLEAFRAQHGGRLADYVVSHAGERAFPRSFQLLADGGALTFFGASTGYYFTFTGKRGSASVDAMLSRAGLRAGEAVLTYYGPGLDSEALVDPVGVEIIEAVAARGGRVAVVCYRDAQMEFIRSLGFGDRLAGVISLEELGRRALMTFDWPHTLPPLPDVRRETAAFKEAVRAFQERTIKPLGQAVGRLLRSADNPRGAPDLVVERAAHDSLAASTSLVRPFVGRVIYAESMEGRRYTFYAPQVWMRQRRILMPTCSILGTHLCNAYEVTEMNRMLAAGQLEVTPPTLVAWNELPEAHQAMWENRHAGATYVMNHALPTPGLRTPDELYEAWAARMPRGDHP
jgi:acrylyl-CoA reductase (NADPH) / 3-hydroxypropionyl-CoA dehydratase / 3-hydroxypropionyl-CoA synthetase